MVALKNIKLVLDDKIIPDAVVLMDKDRIVDYGKENCVQIPDNTNIFDGNGYYVGPGFVDIHCHGGGGFDMCQNPTQAAEHFLKHGETTVLPTFYTTTSKDEFIKYIHNLKEQKKKNNASKIIPGYYMEGPYTNPKFGASPELNKWLGDIVPDKYKEMVDELGSLAIVWAVAPEREGVEDFLKYAKKVNPKAVITIAHSEATIEQAEMLKKYGIKLLTHCTNATGRIKRSAGTRACGPDEFCFLNNDIYAELICDSLGIHVQPEMIKLIIQIKGVDKVVLISDSFVSKEPTPKGYEHITDLSFDASGNLSGSKLTLDAACRNIIKHTSCSICDAFKMASINPAKAIGLDNEVGAIAVGKKANLVVVDEEFNIKNVIFEGDFVC